MKIAIVTGASSGIGREMVFQLSERFPALDEIWVIARREERLKALMPLVSVRLRVFPVNITDPAALSGLIENLKTERPDVKILVNSAGYGKIGKVGTIEGASEDGMVCLNCQALVHLTRAVLPFLRPNSRIIQISSSAAFLPQPGFAVYAATKAFVLSYSRALGQELKERSIFVTAVCPGPVRTEFFEVAETTSKMAGYKKAAMADPKKVVNLAIRDSILKKPVSVYGLPMKCFYLASKIFPHQWLLALMGMIRK